MLDHRSALGDVNQRFSTLAVVGWDAGMVMADSDGLMTTFRRRMHCDAFGAVTNLD
jgi:hypothetical protein